MGKNMFVTIKEIAFFTIITLIAAFTANYFSPAGIALFGDWDASKGVISAKSKTGVVIHQREINDTGVLKKLLDDGVVFMDARSGEDFRGGHIKGAVSIPVNEFDEKMEMIWTKYKKDKMIVTYCSGFSCQDSHHLAQNLEQIGFKNVKVFPGGFPQWEKEGLPIGK